LEKFLIPVVYVKTTLHNIFVYFTMNGKILWKKSCGELQEVSKKERRQRRNVYSLGNWLVRTLKYYRFFYPFFFFKIFVNGYSLLWSPICFSLNYYLNHPKIRIRFLWKPIRNFYFFLKKKRKGKFQSKTRSKTRSKWKFKPNFFFFKKTVKSFYRIRKFYFRLLYIQDITSWPFNGCKTKGKFLC
jgi:hypothetical protein